MKSLTHCCYMEGPCANIYVYIYILYLILLLMLDHVGVYSTKTTNKIGCIPHCSLEKDNNTNTPPKDELMCT